MAELTTHWDDGDVLNVTYTGTGDGDISVLSVPNEGLDRTKELTVSADGAEDVTLTVSQTGLCAQLQDLPEDELYDSDGSPLMNRKSGFVLTTNDGEPFSGSFGTANSGEYFLYSVPMRNGEMFGNISSTRIQTLDVSSLDVSACKVFDGFFGNCSQLTSIDITSWRTPLAITWDGFLGSCSSIENIDLSNLDMSQTYTLNGMFMECTSLISLDLSQWHFTRLAEACYLCDGCTSLRYVNAKGWDTSTLQVPGYMFNNCTSLEWIDIRGWSTESIRSNAIWENWIGNCIRLRNIYLSPGFFITTTTIPLDSEALGFAEDNSLNDWIDHLVSTIPYIREKDGYGEDDTIPLLEHEGQYWYLNDGQPRSIKLSSQLKDATPDAMAELQLKGYTIV